MEVCGHRCQPASLLRRVRVVGGCPGEDDMIRIGEINEGLYALFANETLVPKMTGVHLP